MFRIVSDIFQEARTYGVAKATLPRLAFKEFCGELAKVNWNGGKYNMQLNCDDKLYVMVICYDKNKSDE